MICMCIIYIYAITYSLSHSSANTQSMGSSISYSWLIRELFVVTKPQCITSLSLRASCALATAAMASISGPTYCSPAECQTWKNDKKGTTLVWSRHTSECVSRKNSQEHLTGGWRHRTEAKVVKKHEGTHSTQGTRDFLSSLNFPKIKTRLAADDGVRFLKGP